ncbi:MAG: bifunctional riboflavin kinase/FAD synthetase [Legionella sp.]
MNLLHSIKDIQAFRNGCAAAIGNFDGVHRGHQALLQHLLAQAQRLGLPAVVILFEPQPSEYFAEAEAAPRLSSLREKLIILKEYDIDYVVCLKFNRKLSLLSPVDFAQHYLFTSLRVKYLLLGDDFRFGNQRQGDVTLLKHLSRRVGATVEIFNNFNLLGQRVSSTVIRHYLRQGKLDLVHLLLGRTFSMCGRVIHGQARGREWYIPTANVGIQRINLPLTGVFCVHVLTEDNGIIPGVANLGKRPTVDGNKNSLEVHLFDFDKTIYGQFLHVYFIHKLRDEIKFSAVDKLVTQIRNDIAAAKAYFAAESQNTLNRVELNERI